MFGARKLTICRYVERQLDDFLGIDHESPEDYSMDTNPADLFQDVNACVLNPEATEGPYCRLLSRNTIMPECRRC